MKFYFFVHDNRLRRTWGRDRREGAARAYVRVGNADKEGIIMGPKPPIDRIDTGSGLLRLNGQKLFKPDGNKLPISQIPLDISARRIVSGLQNNGVSVSESDIALIQKIVFTNIDIKQPDNTYHLDIIRSLFQDVQKDGVPHTREKYIYDIAEKLGISFTSIKEIKVDVIKIEDISLNIGTRRDVDRIILVTDQGEASFTVSLDKEPYQSLFDSHSKLEAEVLTRHNLTPGLWAIQKYYGFTPIKIKGKSHGVIFKEFLPGLMASNYTNIAGTPDEKDYDSDLKVVAFSHGRMVGNILNKTGAFPQDMNPENVIINDKEEVICKTCDISGLERDFNKIISALTIDINVWKSFSYHYLMGFLLELRSADRDRIIEGLKKKIKNPALFESLGKGLDHISVVAEKIAEARGTNDDEAKKAIAEAAEILLMHGTPPAGSSVKVKDIRTGKIKEISLEENNPLSTKEERPENEVDDDSFSFDFDGKSSDKREA